jgi:hypothetical protein
MILHTYSAYVYDSPAQLVGPQIEVDLKRSFLPLSQQVVFGFLVHSTLLNISFELSNFCWTRRPISLTVRHSVLENHFVGRPLSDVRF